MTDRARKKRSLWRRSRHCYVCGGKFLSLSEATIEHIIPKSQGGSSNLRNLALSHASCNNIKGSIICRLVWELKMKTINNQPRPYYEPSIVKKLTGKSGGRDEKTAEEHQRSWLEKLRENNFNINEPSYKWE